MTHAHKTILLAN